MYVFQPVETCGNVVMCDSATVSADRNLSPGGSPDGYIYNGGER